MTLTATESGIAVNQGEDLLAVCKLTRANGLLTVHDLESSGNGRALALLVRKLQDIAKTEPVYGFIDGSNPQYESLLALYKRAGMYVSFTLLVSAWEN